MSVVNPYQSPNATDRQKLAPQTHYRTKFWPVYFVSVPLTTVVATGTIELMSFALDIRAELSLIVALSVVLCLFMTAFLTLFFQVFVSDNGIRCFDFWGRYHETPWQDVTQGKPINLFGLRYLRLKAEGHPTLWLPLFLHRPHQFWDHVGGRMPSQVVSAAGYEDR